MQRIIIFVFIRELGDGRTSSRERGFILRRGGVSHRAVAPTPVILLCKGNFGAYFPPKQQQFGESRIQGGGAGGRCRMLQRYPKDTDPRSIPQPP